MKRNLFSLLIASALISGVQPAYSATSDNFNSRKGIKLTEVKGFLQGNCWFFSDFDINRGGWVPNMEGDGAMVSGAGASATEMTGIYTPLLDINGPLSLSFIYKFNLPVKDRRWIKVYAADATGKPQILLDSMELTGLDNSQVFTYNKILSATPGQYKVYINYQGIDGNERIAIDQLSIDAPTHYAGACNVSPVASRDKFMGTASHTASGNVLSNDYDPNHETLTAYLLEESPDGNVDLQKDGKFTFTPKEDFAGSSTHFTYKICDNGSPSLCSINTTATIRFPSRSTLTNFQALYRKDAVDINWNASTDNHSTRYEIERSMDGTYFKQVGDVPAGGKAFSFTDKVSDRTARGNDLYYRLRQVDAAGKVTYSKVLIVRTYGTKSVTAVSVTPDPVVNDIQVGVQLKERSFVIMKVTDNNGSEIIRKTAMGENGVNTYDIEDTHQLQPGMYQLEVIINSNERLTMRLAKS
ncbi:MAG: cadherin-like domain-containing protein [Chitinophagaceae bacterium]|nr:cadherin-like domain-containing protein [Chitinophagaceae bacterium]